jgi:two-component system NtrC family sensor kinase
MSQAVAAGDLDQQIGLRRADEIGELAGSFDTMTLHLRERTEEARRLYEETLQRNKELAEINARLEATQLQLIQSEKLASIGQLTAGIVHDVKNPFAVIMGMAEVLADDENIDEETRHGLKVIRESAVKGNTIVSDLLKFARQSKPEMRYRDLRETVQTSMRLTAYLTRKYNTTADLPEIPLMVTYDSQQVEQVLINMIHNAVQAMPDRGALRIGLKTVGNTAQISVEDSGCGISAEHVKRIFDPFFTTKPEGEGTGLGLSVSYGIIANHGGKIDVESEIGKGTTFTIVLPITQPSTEPGETNS